MSLAATTLVPSPSAAPGAAAAAPAATRRPLRRRPSAAGLFESRRPGRVAARGAKAALLEVLTREPVGAYGDPRRGDRGAVEACLEALAGDAPRGRSSRGGDLAGTWDLEWTTEADVHAISRWLPVSRIQQRIKKEGGALGLGEVCNLMGLSLPGGLPARLEAVADVQESSSTRLAYSFRSFALVLGKRDGSARVPLPVMGAGWTEATYLDADLRVMQNSRGDTLILTRSGED